MTLLAWWPLYKNWQKDIRMIKNANSFRLKSSRLHMPKVITLLALQVLSRFEHFKPIKLSSGLSIKELALLALHAEMTDQDVRHVLILLSCSTLFWYCPHESRFAYCRYKQASHVLPMLCRSLQVQYYLMALLWSVLSRECLQASFILVRVIVEQSSGSVGQRCWTVAESHRFQNGLLSITIFM